MSIVLRQQPILAASAIEAQNPDSVVETPISHEDATRCHEDVTRQTRSETNPLLNYPPLPKSAAVGNDDCRNQQRWVMTTAETSSDRFLTTADFGYRRLPKSAHDLLRDLDQERSLNEIHSNSAIYPDRRARKNFSERPKSAIGWRAIVSFGAGLLRSLAEGAIKSPASPINPRSRGIRWLPGFCWPSRSKFGGGDRNWIDRDRWEVAR